MRSDADLLDLFKAYFLGTFNNRLQYEGEKATGSPAHPQATLICDVLDPKIANLQAREDLPGNFVLADARFILPTGESRSRPSILYFGRDKDGQVILESYNVPLNLVDGKAEDFRISNETLHIDWAALERNYFPATPYTFDSDSATFTIHCTTHLPSGASFTLQEKIGPKGLEILEMVVRDGRNLLGFDTPILYERSPAS